MATTSEIDAGLDDIASIVRAERNKMKDAKNIASGVMTELDNILVKFADVIATIDAIPAGTTNDYEKVVKAKKAKLATEFTALKTKAQTIIAIDMST